MRQHPARTTLLFSMLTASGFGCISPLDSANAVEIDEHAILAQVASYGDSSQFEHVSGKAYASALGGTSLIELFASSTAAVQYRDIAPEVTGSGVVLPEGSILVREVFDAAGAPQRLTIMAKGPAGYNPQLGDWYFAVTDLHGVPVTEDGIARSGRLADCYGCHLPRASDDYLFGVPMIDRGASGTSTTPPAPPPPSTGPVCGDFACEVGETRDSCPKDCKHGHH